MNLQIGLHVTFTEKSVHFSSLVLESWNIGAERQRSGPKVWWAGAEVTEIFKRRAEILPLLLRSHALHMASNLVGW